MAAKKTKKVDYTNVPENLNDHPFYGFTLDEDQIAFRDAIWDPKKEIIFCDSVAGSGKTFVAVATANLMVQYGLYDDIVYVVSPYGESRSGFLPGDITQKSEVYFEPLYQALIKCDVNPETAINNESIVNQKYGGAYVTALTEVYLRGTNIENKILILDETQNFTGDNLKKTLTRVGGEKVKVICCGHRGQIDIPEAKQSGFVKYMEHFKSKNDERVAICNLRTNHRGWVSKTADELEF